MNSQHSQVAHQSVAQLDLPLGLRGGAFPPGLQPERLPLGSAGGTYESQHWKGAPPTGGTQAVEDHMMLSTSWCNSELAFDAQYNHGPSLI